MKKEKKSTLLIVLEIAVLAVLVLLLALVLYKSFYAPTPTVEPTPTPTVEPTPTPTPTPSEEPRTIDFKPHAVESTKPSKLISSTAISVNDVEVESYKASSEISFDFPEYYSSIEGIVTFRGDNYRSGGSYGTAEVTNGTLTELWRQGTSGLSDSDGSYWSGNGWTGQPLIVTWPAETRATMTALYAQYRTAESLTEVIYASLDGYVHFYELETGNQTRDALFLGFTFKGAGALDPRGYPILYCGAGVNSASSSSRAFVVSLVDNTVLYEFGNHDSFSDRGWNMFDSSPLVCAATDQLIYPGENGILYIIHLNTKYDSSTGTLMVDPDEVVKWKYSSVRSGSGKYWLGMEDSAAILNEYLFIADNGGNLMCLDLNTLELVWVQDVLDDTNCSPVIDIEDGHPYIYISTSFHYGWRGYNTTNIPIWKIDAETGEVVWQKDYECYTVQDLSGGVQGTLAVGKNKLSNLIFVPVARTPNGSSGVLAALDKSTGEVVWEQQTQVYSWSSPVAVYDSEGNGYIVYCNSGFYMYLLDGLTGEVLDSVNLGGNIEASPAVFNGRVVVGTRAQRIYCMQIG